MLLEDEPSPVVPLAGIQTVRFETVANLRCGCASFAGHPLSGVATGEDSNECELQSGGERSFLTPLCFSS